MRTYKLTISYDGSRYQGWQRQATTDNTIQYILEWSIGKLVGYRVHIDGSGRTDAGVHARGQVASVKLSKLYDTKELKDSLNRYLPEDIRIVKVELAKNGFHARKSAKGKTVENSIFYNMNITSIAVKSRMYFQEDIVIIIQKNWISKQCVMRPDI